MHCGNSLVLVYSQVYCIELLPKAYNFLRLDVGTQTLRTAETSHKSIDHQ